MNISRLYDLADQLYDMAPWHWMAETDLFSLALPGIDEPAHVSIMGTRGEHLCLALYLGEAALQMFNTLHGPTETMAGDKIRLVLECRQLQISFSSRSLLNKSELAQIKSLGRKYRGENWPKFESFSPGQAPMQLSETEVEWLIVACQQLLIVAPTLRSGAKLTFRNGTFGLQILRREPNAAGAWEDTWKSFSIVPYTYPEPPHSKELADRVAKHKRLLKVLCLFAILPSPVGHPAGVRTFPYLLLVMDEDSAMVVGMKILSTEEQTFPELLQSVPDAFLKIFDQAGVRPNIVKCASEATGHLLYGIGKQLKVDVDIYDQLPLLDRLMESMPL